MSYANLIPVPDSEFNPFFFGESEQPAKNRITRHITTAGIISLRGAGVNVKPYRISTAAKI